MTNNDEESTLLGRGPTKPDTPSDKGIDHELRKQTYGKKLREVQSTTIVHIIWLISFFIIFGKTDSTTCTGTLYYFGDLARWFLLGFVVRDLITMATMMGLERYSHRYDKPPLIYTIFEGIYLAISLGFWIYSIVALSERHGCEGQSLTTLVWVWIILYAILPCVYYCCLCFGAVLINSYQ